MQEELKKLIKQNIKLAQETKELLEKNNVMTKKIRRYVIFAEISSVLKFIIIVIPIILGILYIPPMIGNLLDKYQEFFGIFSSGETINIIENMFGGLKSASPDIDTSAIPPDLLKLLK